MFSLPVTSITQTVKKQVKCILWPWIERSRVYKNPDHIMGFTLTRLGEYKVRELKACVIKEGGCSPDREGGKKDKCQCVLSPQNM